MKKIFPIALVILVLALPSQVVYANHFSCSEAPSTTTTTATLIIQKPANSTDFVKIIDTSGAGNSSTQQPQSSVAQSSTIIKNIYEYLTPATPYQAVVYDISGNATEVIESCAFTTKSNIIDLPPPPPASNDQTSTTQTGINYDIATTVDNGIKQAKILLKSKLSVYTTATITISAPGDGGHAPCNVTVESGLYSSPSCIFISLSPGKTYTVSVVGKDSNNREYKEFGQFTIAGDSSTSSGGGGTSGGGGGTQTGGGGGTQNGTSGGGTTFTPSSNQNAPKGQGILFDIRLQNPLKVDNITDAVRFFVNTLVKIAIPFIVIFFIWAGLKFILAQGKPEEVAKAKKMFWYTIIGTLLILGAWTITNAIVGTVNSITN